MTVPVPINKRRRQLAIHGKFRLGIKDNSRQGRRAIDTFRFTSPDRAAVENLAATYGGTVRPWSDPKASPRDQFEVITDAKEIRVWMPPDCIEETYEMWSGGGCLRRCDGETVEVPVENADGWEPRSVSCICAAKGKMECAYKLRLDLILPDVNFGGVWRLETKSEFVAQELPPMVELIQSMQTQGFTPGVLGLESRQTLGGRHKFVVPVLRTSVTPEQIMSGQAPALEAGEPHPDRYEPWPYDSDFDITDEGPNGEVWGVHDDIIEAEIVSDTLEIDARLVDLPNAPLSLPPLTDAQVEGLLTGKARWSADGKGKVVKAR